jgi:glycosyltransferase involved in cell wall biosynthesis
MIKAGNKIISKHQIRAIICSTPPHSLQLSAMYLSKKWSIPWVADFRDPWTDIFYYQNIDRMSISKSADESIEKRVLKNSSSVVTVSKSIMEKLSEKSEKSKIQVLYNGYDAFDFESETIHTYRDNFKVSYVGNLKSNQNIPELWSVFSEFLSEGHPIKLNFVGNVHPDVISALKDNDMYETTRFMGYVSHEDAIKEMQNSSVLLYIIPQAPDNAGILTGKLFEYLASKRPFFAVGPPDGDAAEILKDLNMGPMIDYSDKSAMEERLRYLFSLWSTQRLHSEIPGENGIKKFERKYQTGKLAKQLRKLIHANT